MDFKRPSFEDHELNRFTQVLPNGRHQNLATSTLHDSSSESEASENGNHDESSMQMDDWEHDEEEIKSLVSFDMDMEEGEIIEYEDYFDSISLSDDSISSKDIQLATKYIYTFIVDVLTKRYKSHERNEIDCAIRSKLYDLYNRVQSFELKQKLKSLQTESGIDNYPFWNKLSDILLDIQNQNKNRKIEKIIYQLQDLKLEYDAILENLTSSLNRELSRCYASFLNRTTSQIEAEKLFSEKLQMYAYKIMLEIDRAPRGRILFERMLTVLIAHPSLFSASSGEVVIWLEPNSGANIIGFGAYSKLSADMYFALLQNAKQAFEQCNNKERFIQLLVSGDKKNNYPFTSLLYDGNRFELYWEYVKTQINNEEKFKEILLTPVSIDSKRSIIQLIFNKDYYKLVNILLDKLSQLNLSSDEFNHILVSRDKTRLPLLAVAASLGDIDVVRKILQLAQNIFGAESLNYNNFINCKSGDNALTALQYAANKTHHETASLLVEMGAEIHPAYAWYKSTFEMICDNPNFEFLKEKIEAIPGYYPRYKFATRQTEQANTRMPITRHDTVINFRSDLGIKDVVAPVTEYIQCVLRERFTYEKASFIDALEMAFHKMKRKIPDKANEVFGAFLQHLVYFIVHRRDGLIGKMDENIHNFLTVLTEQPKLFYIHDGQPTIGIDPKELNHILLNINLRAINPAIQKKLLLLCSQSFKECDDKEGMINLIRAENKYNDNCIIASAVHGTLENLKIIIEFVSSEINDTKIFKEIYLNSVKKTFYRLCFNTIKDTPHMNELALNDAYGKLSHLMEVARTLTQNTLELLDLMSDCDSAGVPLFFNVSRKNDLRMIVFILNLAQSIAGNSTSSAFKKFIDVKHPRGFTALMNACHEKALERAKILVEFGANPLLKNEEQNFPVSSLNYVKNEGEEWDFIRKRADEIRALEHSARAHFGHFKSGKRESTSGQVTSYAKRSKCQH